MLSGNDSIQIAVTCLQTTILRVVLAVMWAKKVDGFLADKSENLQECQLGIKSGKAIELAFSCELGSKYTCIDEIGKI